ncbi:hypothetical protein SAMN04487926_10823 [Paraburkholderia steynii]|uniref:Uncharacterized protein n=1 Tax=Paraburkholderia steynii TaxID=1245441 RepID=A0A7Z7FID3_9BURK|nr:hypothetical protein [Paraburkholderia steynii]SDH78449.1 hypothetical protein SAMN04487926_10823 [Paraburkholderia steynii]
MTDNEAKDSLPSDKIEEIVNEMTPEDVFNETPTEGAKRLVKALSQQTKVAEYLTWQRVEQDAPDIHGNNIERRKAALHQCWPVRRVDPSKR